jgi:carbon-monoxide dehydrogenase medium subunit
VLSLALPMIAHPQIRNRGTIGGSMVHADPAAELPVVAVAAEAQFTIRGPDSERVVAASDFFQGMFTTAVGPDELLTEIHFPAVPARTGWSFKEIARRHGDYAMAGVAVGITLAEDNTCQVARLVYLNVGDGPIDAVDSATLLVGEAQSEALFEQVAERAAGDEIFPFGNVHTTPEYQAHLARVLTKRGLQEAWQRALAD